MFADEQPIQRHAQVLQEVEAVGDLGGLRCSLTCTIGKRSTTVATDDLHLASPMDAEPAREGRRLAVGQEIEHPMALEIHEDGSVAHAAAKREVIDAEHRHPLVRTVLWRGSRQLGTVNKPEQRVAAGAHRTQAKTKSQPFSGLPTQREAHRFQGALQGRRPPLIPRRTARPASAADSKAHCKAGVRR